jgi:hypothetical protein
MAALLSYVVTIYHSTRLSFPEGLFIIETTARNLKLPSHSISFPISSNVFWSVFIFYILISNLFMPKATFVIVGWFAGLTSKNHSKWCT